MPAYPSSTCACITCYLRAFMQVAGPPPATSKQALETELNGALRLRALGGHHLIGGKGAVWAVLDPAREGSLDPGG